MKSMTYGIFIFFSGIFRSGLRDRHKQVYLLTYPSASSRLSQLLKAGLIFP